MFMKTFEIFAHEYVLELRLLYDLTYCSGLFAFQFKKYSLAFSGVFAEPIVCLQSNLYN